MGEGYDAGSARQIFLDDGDGEGDVSLAGAILSTTVRLF